ncbi:TPA: restriction endonuclease subunit S [Escherichia coli]|nr:restriction endonuclease subunit S [Escherichia coli]HAX4784892.1 restriction endonuclease subunit S [Escherichia coli]HAX4807864.1 restriction endonuclease subunit S [Escherichia coli]HAX4844622.1 restriction endonuclease subunit S [Escherichia coli]
MIVKPLIELSKKISSGLTPLRSNPEFWDNGTIPWLKTEQLGEKYIYETNEHISEVALEKTAIRLFPVNSLSIAMYGEGKTRGNLSILKKSMATNQACCNIEIDSDKADYEYVYYFLKTQYDELRQLSSGVRKNLNSNDIKNYPIRLPSSLDEQRKIACVLKVLDDKIALNNRINAELEAMAKTLYDYWFVQFDFPDANGKPYKTSGGKMEYNATLKREIPVRWNTSTLWNIAKYTNGLAMQKYREDSDIYLPVIKIREMNNGISAETERARVDIPEAAVINDGDVLFSWSATLDVKIWSQGKGALNQHIFKVSSDNYPKSFYYFELLNYLKHFKMMADLRKTTMGHITLDHLKQAYICLPPLLLLEEFNSKVHDIFQQHLLFEKENRSLIKLRDWLLPLLMNGQITVK